MTEISTEANSQAENENEIFLKLKIRNSYIDIGEIKIFNANSNLQIKPNFFFSIPIYFKTL